LFVAVKNDLGTNKQIEHEKNPNKMKRSNICMEKRIKEELFTEYPDVLNIWELRQALGIGRAGAYKLLSGGMIRSFKIGNTYKIPKSALVEYINSQCEAGLEGRKQK